MRKRLTIAALLLPGAWHANAQTPEIQSRSRRTANNEAIFSHDLDGIIRHMPPDYSIVTGRGQHVNGRDEVLAAQGNDL